MRNLLLTHNIYTLTYTYILSLIRESGTSASAPVVAAMVTLWNDMRLANGIYTHIFAYIYISYTLSHLYSYTIYTHIYIYIMHYISSSLLLYTYLTYTYTDLYIPVRVCMYGIQVFQ